MVLVVLIIIFQNYQKFRSNIFFIMNNTPGNAQRQGAEPRRASTLNAISNPKPHFLCKHSNFWFVVWFRCVDTLLFAPKHDNTNQKPSLWFVVCLRYGDDRAVCAKTCQGMSLRHDTICALIYCDLWGDYFSIGWCLSPRGGFSRCAFPRGSLGAYLASGRRVSAPPVGPLPRHAAPRW